jgi:SAM-dependent methyltransferase
MIYEYKGDIYPEYLKKGNACQYIAPVALQFCKGHGVDVGCNQWPLDGAVGVELKDGGDAMRLPYNDHRPEGTWDYVFSSHCLEHIENWRAALIHWQSRIRPGGVLFLYLPHPDMKYWLPENCEKHVNSWDPQYMADALRELGFVNVMHSERDLAWGFAVVGFKA